MAQAINCRLRTVDCVSVPRQSMWNFLPFLFCPFLPTRYRCRELLWHLITLSDKHTHTHSFGRGIGPSRRLLPVNKRHSQKTDRRPSGGNRSHNPCKSSTAGPNLGPCDQSDRLHYDLVMDEALLVQALLKSISAVLCHCYSPSASYTFIRILPLL